MPLPYPSHCLMRIILQIFITFDLAESSQQKSSLWLLVRVPNKIGCSCKGPKQDWVFICKLWWYARLISVIAVVYSDCSHTYSLPHQVWALSGQEQNCIHQWKLTVCWSPSCLGSVSRPAIQGILRCFFNCTGIKLAAYISRLWLEIGSKIIALKIFAVCLWNMSFTLDHHGIHMSLGRGLCGRWFWNTLH